MGKDKSVKNNQCYVIMPISDPKEYESGHFRRVYEDIFIPAIEAAGFIPKRADDDKSSSMIQISIVKDIIESPMAICDLSTRNPNVLFELGIRQAFDLPVVLVQEMDTPRIFDISTINTIDYRKTLGYREVIEDRDKIKSAIIETKDNTKGVNSIIRLLGIESAKTKANIDENALLYTISNQIQGVMNKLENVEMSRNSNPQNSDGKLDEKLNEYYRGAYLDAEIKFFGILNNYKSIQTEKDAKKMIEDIKSLSNSYSSNPFVPAGVPEERKNTLETIEQILLGI